MTFAGLPPDDGRLYGELVEKAIAHGSRAVRMAGSLGLSPAWKVARIEAEIGFAQVNAMLAVAERLDVLIGSVFDERVPIAVCESDPPDEEEVDHG